MQAGRIMPSLYHLLRNNTRDINKRLEESGVRRIYNLSLPHLAVFLLFREGSFIVIEDSPESASILYNDLLFFRDVFGTKGNGQTDAPQTRGAAAPKPPSLAYFPPPSDPESSGERAKVLFNYMMGREISIITSSEACRTGLIIAEIEDKVLSIKKGAEMERGGLEEWLRRNGYKNVSVVMERGEYSRRGWLFDIYPATGDSPVRVEFFGDEIDLIRAFDIETQRSIKEIQELTLFPSQEGAPERNLIDDMLEYGPVDLFIHSDRARAFEHRLQSPGTTVISHMPFAGEGIDALELSVKGLGVLPEERKDMDDIPRALAKTGKQVIAVLRSDAQAERLGEIMLSGDMIAPRIKRSDLLAYDGNLCITKGRLSSGVNLPELLLLTDREIFGERPAHRSIRKSKVSRLLLSIDDLKPGDFVVHKDRGIGKFTGLQRQKTDEHEEDLISLEYANGRLYVPFHSIDKLQKYSAGEGHTPSLDKLGGKAWQRTKQRVREGIKEMAEKLLKLYAERSVARGFVFSEDTPMHREFDDFFPYEETPDQAKAVEEIRRHMHSEAPMDMLLCGDVGYGKTEVAMRAAFRAVFDGKQVAVLVPTTLLAEQHYRTFTMRFSAFPVKIDYLSRFKNRDTVKKTVRAVADGEVDIVIGTHMLLNKKLAFHDLGLLIIDEEHRFGVAQKERLKELRKGADVLTLTATPIPRTLQMSLSGIREMSTIETPPEERLAVRSIVTLFSAEDLREAVEREVKRGGQVFFVHNRIKDIEKISAYIKGLAPHARIATAHGQMKEDDLEKIMLGFLHRETDVLVCTAIIGSGLDIATANTIIVDRADTFGLADLYQLKGRVGRGNAQAYAYFLIPGEDLITDEAKKRLQAIQEMSYLGAGFRLALKDLEIRGAGNLLGPEQSGYILGVGFDMYMEMLEKAVAELKGEEIREEVEPQISLRLSAFIPEEYIPDITLRLSIYKRISSAKSPDALSDLSDEIRDRFGAMPDEAVNLIHIMRIKLLAKRLYITKVLETDKRYGFIFLLDHENKYKIPDNFFDGLLKILFSISSGTSVKDKGTGRIRFLPDGFELDMRGIPPNSALAEMERVLFDLTEKLQDAGNHGGSNGKN
ncbi:MAG: transcription-repair coupling factor [Nitrospirae bacterium]|nr:transcription-repair coupling factor [Nitrospirota bacterium]